jgi:hypothetical protein
MLWKKIGIYVELWHPIKKSRYEKQERERKRLRGTDREVFVGMQTHVPVLCRRIVTFSTIVFMSD